MSGTKRFASIGDGNTDVDSIDILVVDDDESVREFLTAALEELDYKAKSAEDCDKAKELLAEETFRLILCDVNLPGMSGDEFLPFCKQNYPDTEIILITGRPGINAAVHAVKEGAFDYLPKPITLETLKDRVSTALDIANSKTVVDGSGNRLQSTVAGYKIIKTLGSGSMGVVFLVEKDGAKYALKVLRADITNEVSQRNLKRFARESDILAELNHPNIVRFLEHGIWREKNTPYFVMEFISGQSLSYHIQIGTLTLNEKISVMRQIASALAFIHDHEILHRDIKPANILITRDNLVKITDFGIARITNSDITMPQEALGSPAYMSPEAFGGTDQYAQSDIFSFGSICYELFTGQKPFDGDDIATMMDSIRNERPVEPIQLAPDIPPYVQDILAKMLAKKPEDRFASATEIIRALDHQYADGASGITSRLLRVLMLRKPTWR